MTVRHCLSQPGAGQGSTTWDQQPAAPGPMPSAKLNSTRSSGALWCGLVSEVDPSGCMCPIIGCVVSDKLTILGAIGCKRLGDDCGIGNLTDPGTNTWGPQPAAPERMKRTRHRNWPCFTRNSTRPGGDTETRPEYDSEAAVEATVLPKLPSMDGQEAAWSSAYPDSWLRSQRAGGRKYKKPESESWFDENPSSIISSYQVLYQLYQYPPNQTNFSKPAALKSRFQTSRQLRQYGKAFLWLQELGMHQQGGIRRGRFLLEA